MNAVSAPNCLMVEPGDQRRHQHNHADAQHHAENRQRTAQLVRPQRVHRLLQIFAVRLCHNASI
jgi:hypothetical protein